MSNNDSRVIASDKATPSPESVIDQSPLPMEMLDEEDDDERSKPELTICRRFGLPIVAIIWLLTVITIIMGLMLKPLVMIGALVVVNVIFPILLFSQWFGNHKYDSLDQFDRDEYNDEGDIQFSIPKARSELPTVSVNLTARSN